MKGLTSPSKNVIFYFMKKRHCKWNIVVINVDWNTLNLHVVSPEHSNWIQAQSSDTPTMPVTQSGWLATHCPEATFIQENFSLLRLFLILNSHFHLRDVYFVHPSCLLDILYNVICKSFEITLRFLYPHLFIRGIWQVQADDGLCPKRYSLFPI